jgi:hypothetical protein
MEEKQRVRQKAVRYTQKSKHIYIYIYIYTHAHKHTHKYASLYV